jgi:hypothetical protein
MSRSLADRIFVEGILMDNPCHRCVENGLCIRSHTMHCVACTHVPVKCTPAFEQASLMPDTLLLAAGETADRVKTGLRRGFFVPGRVFPACTIA